MKMFIAGAFGTLAFASASIVSPSYAASADSLPPAMVQLLDKQDVDFNMTEAKRRRLEYMQREGAREQRYNRGGYGRYPGYRNSARGYGPRDYGRSSREWDRRW